VYFVRQADYSNSKPHHLSTFLESRCRFFAGAQTSKIFILAHAAA